MTPRALAASVAIIVASLGVEATFAQATKPMAQVKPTIADIAKQKMQCVVLITTHDKNGDGLALGSGFVVRADGIIVTNHHVIDGAFGASVEASNGDIFDNVTLLDVDKRRDLAVLKIKALKMPVCSLGDSDSAEVGQHVIAIGNPLGLSQTVSDGIVSALRQMTGYHLIQLTAPISGGSSGGPLLNDAGDVIGVTSAGFDEGQNLNLAVPINYVKPLIASLDGSRPRALDEYNAGNLKLAKKVAPAPTVEKPPETVKSTPPPVLVEAPKTLRPDEAARSELRAKGPGVYLQQKLGVWKEEDAKAVLGEPVQHRFGYDLNKTVDGDIFSYRDPSESYRLLELYFDLKTKVVKTVYLQTPTVKMTWDDCKRVWGENVNTLKNADGSRTYGYNDRHLTVMVDKSGVVQVMWIY